MPFRTIAATAALAVAAGCGPAGPRALSANDSCSYCRMAIGDTRFGATVMLATGRQLAFDSIECLTSYLAAGADVAPIAAVYVSDYEARQLVDARTAVYVRSASVRSPMGRELAAFDADADTTALRARYGGAMLSWSDVQRLAADSAPRPPHPGTARQP